MEFRHIDINERGCFAVAQVPRGALLFQEAGILSSTQKVTRRQEYLQAQKGSSAPKLFGFPRFDFLMSIS